MTSVQVSTEAWPQFATVVQHPDVASPMDEYRALVSRIEGCMVSGELPCFEDMRQIAGLDPQLFTVARNVFGRNYDTAFHRWWFDKPANRLTQAMYMMIQEDK